MDMDGMWHMEYSYCYSYGDMCSFKCGAAPKTETGNNLRRFHLHFTPQVSLPTPDENRPESPRRTEEQKNSLAKILRVTVGREDEGKRWIERSREQA